MSDEPTTTAEETGPEPSLTWGYQAWRLWCAGNRNKSAIFRTLKAQYGDAMPKWDDCITKALARESKIARAALDIDETDALMEYIAGLEEQFGEADRLMRTGDNDNAKLGGLKVKVDLLAKLAAAKGVVTERKAQEHSGSVQVNTVNAAAVLDDEETTRLAVELTNRIGLGAALTGAAGNAVQPGDTGAVAAGEALGGPECEVDGAGGGPD
jgi:hypothetical protein